MPKSYSIVIGKSIERLSLSMDMLISTETYKNVLRHITTPHELTITWTEMPCTKKSFTTQIAQKHISTQTKPKKNLKDLKMRTS